MDTTRLERCFHALHDAGLWQHVVTIAVEAGDGIVVSMTRDAGNLPPFKLTETNSAEPEPEEEPPNPLREMRRELRDGLPGSWLPEVE